MNQAILLYTSDSPRYIARQRSWLATWVPVADALGIPVIVMTGSLLGDLVARL